MPRTKVVNTSRNCVLRVCAPRGDPTTREGFWGHANFPLNTKSDLYLHVRERQIAMAAAARAATRREEWSRRLVAEGRKLDLEFETGYVTKDRAWPGNYAAARRLLRDKKPKTARMEKAKPVHGGEKMQLPGARRPVCVGAFQVRKDWTKKHTHTHTHTYRHNHNHNHTLLLLEYVFCAKHVLQLFHNMHKRHMRE